MFEKALSLISRYDRIIIHRHNNPDGDAIGSQVGLKHLILENFKGKEVYTVGDAAGRYAFMADSTADIIPDEYYRGALAIILDTSAKSLISDERYTLAETTLRIDHHIFCEKIADTEITDTSFESCCGMIAEFARECSLHLTPTAAKSIYTGMVTDSGRFRFSSVTGDTLRCAAALLDIGIDTDTLFSHLYTEEIGELKFRAHITSCVKLTENGVAYLTVTRAMQEKYAISFETASNCVSYISTIKNSIIWLAFIEEDSGEFRVRLRSRFAEISGLAEKYGGGGHACAAGASVKNAREKRALLADADRLIADYKENHEGWL